jgi:hypothetical protein
MTSATQVVRSVDNHIPHSIGKDRLFVIAVHRHDIASARSRLKTVLAHEVLDLRVIDHRSLPTKRSSTATNRAPADLSGPRGPLQSLTH